MLREAQETRDSLRRALCSSNKLCSARLLASGEPQVIAVARCSATHIARLICWSIR